MYNEICPLHLTHPSMSLGKYVKSCGQLRRAPWDPFPDVEPGDNVEPVSPAGGLLFHIWRPSNGRRRISWETLGEAHPPSSPSAPDLQNKMITITSLSMSFFFLNKNRKKVKEKTHFYLHHSLFSLSRPGVRNLGL